MANQTALADVYRVQYDDYGAVTAGDYVTVFFEVQREGGDQFTVQVDISRSFQASHDVNDLGTQGPLAAKAVQLFLLGQVPLDSHRNEDRENAFLISSYWYPGYPGEPLTMDPETWQNFPVGVPLSPIRALVRDRAYVRVMTSLFVIGLALVAFSGAFTEAQWARGALLNLGTETQGIAMATLVGRILVDR